ncbi:hypothetical protein [Thermaerobacillus caldiproteolyticus]|uniref:hypothetical protein n=1 Tax=Thermaerobacillus caldiproteolyticus TaxID=247480 RepID=UPI001E5831A0|nr:hypothetical protein [Anoxybacillus caldiproteolyticus]
MGIVVSAGLGERFSQWFVSISNEVTCPIFTFLSAGLRTLRWQTMGCTSAADARGSGHSARSNGHGSGVGRTSFNRFGHFRSWRLLDQKQKTLWNFV